ncbi:peptidase U32 family protein [Desulfotalea psychrophila]|uniref:Probable proteinase (Collagenase) n=1 Tax=Desulfotalea psychrophila (strain LSv54 / DSM 12343) TaxID=177439 RepID=Q6AQM1_DESPS|nr:U32 family peptidase [Desulfotalea psychrophila]CAG35352.1 probable proteinase (collagenase) precursor [Desulfotalea psychrophila LSv54]
MTRRKIELLSPARDLQCGKSAIDHGADAVYIGGPSFGARSAAGNSLADIEQLVRYAHRYFARVYVALNTLLADDELDVAVAQIYQLYDLGVDALIIQDMGLLECDLPPIALHASTQCNNRSPEKVDFLQGVGFEQVVLARELSLTAIRDIHRKTDVALECFIHGALCVSYSGQCYISEVICGRSGNRGECAQFCRHRYQLKDGRGKLLADEYVLSLKDLNLSSSVEDLLDAGVSSLKIEGRLKGEQYVKNVTAHYRQQIDEICARRPEFVPASSGSCSFSFQADPERSFNRGHGEYYLRGQRAKTGATKTPKSVGQFIGRITGVGKRTFQVERGELLHNGDGCCCLKVGGDLLGFQVNRVEGNTVHLARAVPLKVGMELYRNLDPLFNKGLDQSGICRRIGVQLKLVDLGEELCLSICDEDGVKSETRQKIERLRAQKEGIGEQTARRQLLKVGETIFKVNQLEVELASNLFVTAAVFNGLRRQAFETHIKQRLLSYKREDLPLVPNNIPWLTDKVTVYDNITNKKARAFYQRHGVHSFSQTGTEITTLMHCKYCVRNQYGLCSGQGEKSAEPLFINDKTEAYTLIFDCKKCEMKVLRGRQDT